MRISELAKTTNCDIETIRFYEKTGLLEAPPRASNGYRKYQAQHQERLLFIRQCRSLQIGLPAIKELLQLKQHPKAGCQEVDDMLEQQISRVRSQIQTLQHLEEQLVVLRNRCQTPRSIAQCAILQGLESSFPAK
jgi:Cd(II)/Pb(II)-responsive transcriptional regulator